jgi:hypothetical protein
MPMPLLTTREARNIASDWKSPAGIGEVLSAFAHGFPVVPSALLADIDATIANDNPTGNDLVELVDLKTFVIAYSGDPELFYSEPKD